VTDTADGASAAGDSSTPGVARGARCRLLVAAPWRLAVRGRGPAVPPQFANHLHRERGVHLRQVLVGFASRGDATAALGSIRRAAAGCDRFRVGGARPAAGPGAFAHGGSGAAPGRMATVVLRPAPPRVTGAVTGSVTGITGAGAGSADGFAVRVVLVARNGRARTGYLVVDRAGPVLSVLWLLGPGSAVTADEAAATRRAAVAKASPLAR
jgi:hypothetical protein